MKISGILLAAGESTRMGTPKQLLHAGGELIVIRALKSIAVPEIREIIVVLGHQAAQIRKVLPEHDPQVRIAINSRYREGMSSSIRTGIEQVSPHSEAALITLVDHPYVLQRTVSALIEEWRKSGRGIIVPRFGGRRGHPVIFARRYFDELSNLSGPPGARGVLRRHADDLDEIETDDEAVIRDIDTPDDLASCEKYFSERQEIQ